MTTPKLISALQSKQSIAIKQKALSKQVNYIDKINLLSNSVSLLPDDKLLRQTPPLQLVDMKYIVELTGMTDKWFYALIKQQIFPKPIKLGRSSRWILADIEQWILMQSQKNTFN